MEKFDQVAHDLDEYGYCLIPVVISPENADEARTVDLVQQLMGAKQRQPRTVGE